MVYCARNCIPEPAGGAAAPHDNSPPGVSSALPGVYGAATPPAPPAASSSPSLPSLLAAARAAIAALPPGQCSCILEPPPGVDAPPRVGVGAACSPGGSPAGWTVQGVGCQIPPVALPHGPGAAPMAPIQVAPAPPVPRPLPPVTAPPGPIYGVPPIAKLPVTTPVQGGPIYGTAPIATGGGTVNPQPVVNVNGTTSVCCPCPA